MTGDDIDARLREIVTAHVVVGGYPDTMGIARAAYALARADMARHGVVHMERTVWDGGSQTAERVDMEAWIEHASPSDVEALLDDRMDATSDDAQTLLRRIWDESGAANGGRIGSGNVDARHHWGHGERAALRRAVKRLRPGLVEPEPGQGFLL